jgi:hypothetical protein
MRALSLLVVAFSFTAIAFVSNAQVSPLSAALSRCLSEAIARGYLDIMGGPPDFKPRSKHSNVILSCDGPFAVALFSAMELVSEQKLHAPAPPQIPSISRTAGNINCQQLPTRDEKGTYTNCTIVFPANERFVDKLHESN